MVGEEEEDEEEEVLYEYDACEPIPRSELTPPENITSQLRRAIAEDNVAAVKQYLVNKHDVNLVDNLGYTCLHTAVMYRSINSLRYLCSLEETRVDACDNFSETSLMLVLTKYMCTDIVICLIEHKCDVNIPNYLGVTPLHVAVRRSDTFLPQLLAERGANIDAKDSEGLTPLHEAVAYQNYENVCMLLYYNASVNEASIYTQCTPFHLALRFENAQIAELLVDYVDDFSLMDVQGETVFGLALNSKMPVAVEIVEQGGNVHETRRGLPLIFTRLDDSTSDSRVLFQKLWAKVDLTVLFKSGQTFLPYFLRNELHFSEEERLRILETVFDIDEYDCDCYGHEIYVLVYQLCNSAEARLEWTWMLLSRGASIGTSEVDYLYRNYGYCPEIVAILRSETAVHMNGEDPFVQQIIYNHSVVLGRANGVLALIDLPEKSEFYAPVSEGCVPSLLQASRDVCRRIIFTKYQREPNYMAYNIIETLDVPDWLRGVLLLKSPIYM